LCGLRRNIVESRGGRLMIVRHKTGWEETTQRSGSGPAADEALARAMLSEQGPVLTVVRTTE
jgi:hypothetical protein